jgi:hypothetical protein
VNDLYLDENLDVQDASMRVPGGVKGLVSLGDNCIQLRVQVIVCDVQRVPIIIARVQQWFVNAFGWRDLVLRGM